MNDLRYAMRTLARSPVLTLAAVVTLGLGIGANTAIFGVVDRLFFRPPAHVVDPDRVVRLNVTTTESRFGTYTIPIGAYPRYLDFRDHARSFSAVAGSRGRGFNLGLGPRAEWVTGKLVTGSFFSLLGVRPELGRFFGVDEDSVGNPARVAVLSREFWKRRFGEDRAVLGTTLLLGRSRYTVIGVAPQGFAGIDLDVPDVWLPFSAAGPEFYGRDVFGSHASWLGEVIARLRPAVNPAAAAAECTAIYRGGFVQSGDSTATVSLGSVHEALGPNVSSDAKLPVWLAATCAIVLLIACANVANLLLARAVQRKREIAVRLALGASRGRLARQLLAESAVLTVLGGGAALLITLWVGPVLRAALLPDAAAGAVLDIRVLLFTAMLVVATAVLAGLVPAYEASAPDLSSGLKAGEREGTFPRSATRTGVMVGQVALTLVLLTGAGLFVSSLRHVQGLRLGFDADRLIVASVDLRALGYKRARINALYQEMRDRVKALPGVSGASLAIGDPFRNLPAVPLAVPGLDSLPRVESGGPYVAAVTPDYFRTMGTAVRRGRAFSASDIAGAQRVAVVNETMARLTIDPLPRLFAAQVRPWRLGSALLSVFGALGLLLAAIGLYGVLSYVVSQRTPEMGVRIALGAGRRQILELVMGQAIRVMVWGVVLGVVGALAAGRAIASLLYGVTPRDPLVLSVAIAVLAAVAVVASYLPARRATQVDPMVALRYE